MRNMPVVILPPWNTVIKNPGSAGDGVRYQKPVNIIQSTPATVLREKSAKFD